jgi:hypothetical protein
MEMTVQSSETLESHSNALIFNRPISEYARVPDGAGGPRA